MRLLAGLVGNQPAGNQPATDRSFGMLAGTVAVEDFFAPDHVAAILG